MEPRVSKSRKIRKGSHLLWILTSEKVWEPFSKGITCLDMPYLVPSLFQQAKKKKKPMLPSLHRKLICVSKRKLNSKCPWENSIDLNMKVLVLVWDDRIRAITNLRQENEQEQCSYWESGKFRTEGSPYLFILELRPDMFPWKIIRNINRREHVLWVEVIRC